MPDTRTHRGPHPEDVHLFDPGCWPTLQAATADLSWLLTHGYAWKSALKLVGDRHALTARQRTAVWRSACSDESLARRQGRLRSLDDVRGQALAIDGYNALLTVESALGGGVVLAGRDGCFRDLASVHGTYRKVEETVPAIVLIGEVLAAAEVNSAAWYVDSPVSNSGRLRAILEAEAGNRGWDWQVHLVQNPDRCLADSGSPVASADSWVLDHCDRWANLARSVVEIRVPDARIVPL